MKQIYLIPFVCFLYGLCALSHCAYSQNYIANKNNKAPSQAKFVSHPFENKVFIEEQGQFKKISEERKVTIPGNILFAVANPEFNAYFTEKGITFLFSKTVQKDENENDREEEKEHKVSIKWEVVTMEWSNPAPNMEITAFDKVNSYYTYGRFADKSQYDHVSAYKKLKYKNLYDGVDAEFELPESGGIKYQFIVHAGHTIPSIAYKMHGTKNLTIDEKGNLSIQSEFNDLIDKTPVAWTKNNQPVPVKYVLKNNFVKIEAESPTILSEDLIIDPWLIDPSIPSTDRAFDIHEDSLGNVYVYGGALSAYQAQKYNSSGVLQWTHSTTHQYYGDIAVGNSGSVYLTSTSSGYKKLNTSGAVVWSAPSPGGGELWRLDFNKSKTILALGGNFLSSSSLSNIDTATGALVNLIGYPTDTWAVATDCNGDVYSMHQGSSPCILRKTKADFTPAGSALTSGFCISGYTNAYSTWGGFNCITISGPYLYIYDGLHLRRYQKSTLTIIDSVAVPNGLANNCSGVAFDYCGNIYVGTMSTIEKYSASLDSISSILTPAAVYDIRVSNGDLIACGNAFVASFGPTCSSPPPLVVSATSADASCKPGSAAISVSGGTVPYSYLWQPGGQTTDTVISLTPGTYNYTVDDVFCQSYVDSVIINQIPPVTLAVSSNTKETCINRLDGTATVIATDGIPPYTYSWNTNPIQTNPTATGLSAGIYLATVVDADSCWDTISVVITRNPDPVAKFGNTSECEGTATLFNDSSTTAAGTISNWFWNFGDSSIVNTAQHPSHLYANAGNYSTTLIVQNTFSCADTITKPLVVYFNPVANFTTLDVCLNDSVFFTDSSYVDISATVSTYLWVFNDGTPTSSLKNPAHFYSSEGSYNVTLLSTTNQGCSNAVNKTVNVFDPPTTNFSVADVCLIDSALFINSSTNPNMGTIASMLWSFGDGSLLNNTVLNPHHLYTAPGTYPIRLITRSSNLACADTLTDSITVFPMPIANFTASDVCLQQSINFNDSSTVTNNNTVTAWNWTFGDGVTNTLQNPVTTYAAFGQYNVALIVITNNGCKDTVSKDIVVHPLPTASFSTNNVCLGDSAFFTNFSTLPTNITNDVIDFWNWDFADNTTIAITPSTSHLYATIGSYNVELKVVSDFGCPDSVSKTIVINPNPQVIFSADDTIGCEPLCINLTDASVISPGNNDVWGWNLGDGATVSTSSVYHCYNNDSLFAPKQYTITLTVTSDSGCVSTLTKNNYITVYPEPEANFNVSPGTTTITDPAITITNLSTGANFWEWNFGGSIIDTSSTQNPPEQTYADTGAYVIRLITTTQFACADTSYQTIVIEPDFMFYVPNAFTPNDDGVNDSFSGQGMFMQEFEMFIFDRWGNMVYQTNDINKPWTGKANNGTGSAQADVYIYLMKVTDLKFNKHSYRGTVTLVK